MDAPVGSGSEPAIETLRVALVSDTHGVLDPRIAALVARCDIAVHAGDIGSDAVLEAMRPRSGRVVAVLGNNDVPAKWPAEHQARLGEVAMQASVALPGGDLVVVHGHRSGKASRRHQRLRRDYPWARGVVYGHSHRLVVDDTAVPWVLNPGAAGKARTFGGPCCIVLHAGPDGWRVQTQQFSPAK